MNSSDDTSLRWTTSNIEYDTESLPSNGVVDGFTSAGCKHTIVGRPTALDTLFKSAYYS